MSGNPTTEKATSSYTLVICEKPDSARRVAEALSSSSSLDESMESGARIFRVRDPGGKRYVVCAATGHLYGISDTVKERRIYPALDLEWFPLSQLGSKAGKSVPNRIRAIRRLSEGADRFVNACDFDIEGETIGHNILLYACSGKEGLAFRARFSTLTRDEIVRAFQDENLGPSGNLAVAGRLRHAIDFMWGVNLSRALSESLRTAHSFRTVSIGRVQGPTLNFVVEKEVELGTFVPTPYWTAKGEFRKGDLCFEAIYASQRVLPSKRAAEQVREACDGREGIVSRVERLAVNERPPAPFNLGDLQRESFRRLGYSPSRTLRAAERLYLAALISYPRTGSQKLPVMDYGATLSRIAAIPEYTNLVEELVSKERLRPAEGQKTDPAHPAIHPTGESPRTPLAEEERRVFDLIVRRFLSCFGEEAIGEETAVEISVGEHIFKLEERRLLEAGWKKFETRERKSVEKESSMASALREGDRVNVEHVGVDEHFRVPPARYDQATLLEKMEKEAIGTKATRADTISTLVKRGYVTERMIMIPTELGLSLIEVMRDYCPQIISTRLTRDVESQLEAIETSGVLGDDFFDEILSVFLGQIAEVRSHAREIEKSLQESSSESRRPSANLLGRCPICKDGSLRIIRSYKSGKRFVGCTNYSKGCRASAPLPQRGQIKPTSRPCTSCGWPVVYVRAGRYPWRLCVNDKCPRKVNVYAMQNFQKLGGGRS